MRDAEFPGDFFRSRRIASRERYHLDAINLRQSLQIA